RAVRRAGSDHPRPPAAGVPAPARGRAEDGDLRHPRHRRGDQARRSDRDPARGGPPGAVRHARPHPRPPRRRLRRALRRRRSRPEAPGSSPPGGDRARAAERRSAGGCAAGTGLDHAPRRALADDVRGRRPARGRRRRRHADRPALGRAGRPRPLRAMSAFAGILAQGPVIPDFGESSDCVTENHLFCRSWVADHWGDTLQPALLQHLKLAVIAVAIGFVLSFAAALLAHRYRRVDRPIGVFSDFLYTIPSLALFQLLVPVTGLTVTTVEVALVS